MISDAVPLLSAARAGKPTSSSGRISVSGVSAYDLPDAGSGQQPLFVSMTVLGAEVRTGPPTARLRDRNSYKFVSGKDSSLDSENDIIISAPLSALYPATVTFRVAYSSAEYNLVADFDLKRNVRVNEPQWIILTLEPELAVQTRSVDSDRSVAAVEASNFPSIRLKILLEGPYRPEVSSLIALAKAWFQSIDAVAESSNTVITSFTQILPEKMPLVKYLLIPSVPFAAIIVAFLPIILGVLVIGLPLFLPLIFVVFACAIAIGATGVILYISTKHGRDTVSHILGPVYSTFLSSSVGQSFMYDTGPRPSPVSLAQTILPNDMIGRLFTSLLIDFIGSCSYLLPIVGESFDVAWAPIQTILIMAMYEECMPSLKYVSFLEEIIPFTDVLPSATLGWVRQFSPAIFDEGKKRVYDLSVVVRGEKEALMKGSRQRPT